MDGSVAGIHTEYSFCLLFLEIVGMVIDAMMDGG